MPPLRTEVKVALFGFGNVGRSFARYIQASSGKTPVAISIRAIADSSGGIFLDDTSPLQRILTQKEKGLNLIESAGATVIRDQEEYLRAVRSAGISVLVESLPTNIADGQPALRFIASALEQGISVVTVDKGPLVYGLKTLTEASTKGGVKLGYSGTTGVSVPDEITSDRVLEIRGVLNGTTNYILTEMQERNASFEEALANARASGVAEPDSSLDVEGWDTASKILILAKSLMGAEDGLAEVSRIGIGPETESLIKVGRESNRIVRLVGRARIWQGRVRVSVAPKLVERDSPFYSVSGTSKAAVFRTEGRGSVLATARSGRDAISQIIVDDIARIGS